MSDIVNQPPHYISDKGIETIDVIEAFTKDLEPFEAYCTGNIIKYICRWKHKNGLEDLKKARWYINKLLGETDKEKFSYPNCEDGWNAIGFGMLIRDDQLYLDIPGIEYNYCLDNHDNSIRKGFKLPDGSEYLIELKRAINDERSS